MHESVKKKEATGESFILSVCWILPEKFKLNILKNNQTVVNLLLAKRQFGFRKHFFI